MSRIFLEMRKCCWGGAPTLEVRAEIDIESMSTAAMLRECDFTEKAIESLYAELEPYREAKARDEAIGDLHSIAKNLRERHGVDVQLSIGGSTPAALESIQ